MAAREPVTLVGISQRIYRQILLHLLQLAFLIANVVILAILLRRNARLVSRLDHLESSCCVVDTTEPAVV